jgi:hypothetical protein
MDGADPEQRAVGEEADAGPALAGDQDVVELQRHGRRGRLRLSQPDDRDLAAGHLERGEVLGGGGREPGAGEANDSCEDEPPGSRCSA